MGTSTLVESRHGCSLHGGVQVMACAMCWHRWAEVAVPRPVRPASAGVGTVASGTGTAPVGPAAGQGASTAPVEPWQRTASVTVASVDVTGGTPYRAQQGACAFS